MGRPLSHLFRTSADRSKDDEPAHWLRDRMDPHVSPAISSRYWVRPGDAHFVHRSSIDRIKIDEKFVLAALAALSPHLYSRSNPLPSVELRLFGANVSENTPTSHRVFEAVEGDGAVLQDAILHVSASGDG